MPLLGKAAMLLSFDVESGAGREHDDWHTHEHLPERLSIPGFLRGTRWTALLAQPRYFVMYEVRELRTLLSPAYLRRLNHPTPWTSKIMPHYRGMTRGLCSVVASLGNGLGDFGLLTRFSSVPDMASSLAAWLAEDLLPTLPSRPGLGSVHFFQAAAAPAMTNEQRIRGADVAMAWALLTTGYDEADVAALANGELSQTSLGERGALGVGSALYRTEYTLTSQEIGATRRSARRQV